MHPILGNRARLGAYLLGWLPFSALLVIQYLLWKFPLLDALAMAIPAALLGSVLFLTCGYLCQAMPLKEGKTWALICTWSVAAIVMGSIWCALLFQFIHLLGFFPFFFKGRALLPKPNFGIYISFIITGAILYLAVVALHYVLIAQDQSRQAERTEQDLRVLARDAELKALRAQLNPHFLFNSLNSISALTTIDPKRAREMCVLLADFLRKSLKLGERPLVTLGEEVDLLRAYLAIEQIRFGSRLTVNWAIDPESESVQIPTLLLQPLVENAIKHGIAALPEGGSIGVSATRKGGFVEILLENPLDPDAEHPQGLGLGLRQVKLRLQGRYGPDIFFEAALKEGRHKVLMVFPTEVPA